MNYVSKILLTCSDVFVFTIKRSPLKPEKDKKLEMFGGNVDPGESPIEGLIRELREEEESGILAEKVLRQTPSIKGQFIIDEKMQVIYQMSITDTEFRKLKAHPDESYGIRTVSVSTFDEPDQFNLNSYTPKTIKIFSRLQMI